MQVQMAPNIPLPEKIFINFPFSLEKRKQKLQCKRVSKDNRIAD